MKSPLASGSFLVLEEAESTQDVAADFLSGRHSAPVPGAIFAYHQTVGRGRLGRRWHSARGESLTVSLVFCDYAGHSRPWLVGMGVAVAAAEALDCRLRWPNDLVLEGKKVGGVLTELLPSASGQKVPVVGVGVNLGQRVFPEEIAPFATSLALEGRRPPDALEAAWLLLRALGEVPEPDEWSSLREPWMRRDDTPGKTFRLPDGRIGVAVGVAEQGELLCEVEGKRVQVYAADALGVGS